MTSNDYRRRLQPWARNVPRLFCALIMVLHGCGERRVEDVAPAPTLLLPRAFQGVDPRFAGDVVTLRVSRLLFASLVTLDPETAELRPQLAERYVVESPTRYRVWLRPGLRFSDGSPLNADDVKATFEGIVHPALGSRYAGTYRRIKRIDVAGPLEITFELDGPHATFLTDLEMPVVRAEDALKALSTSPALVTSGPYRIKAIQRGSLVVEENPHWMGPPPRVSPLGLKVVRDDNIRAMRLLHGAGDLALDAIPALLQPLFTDRKDFEVQRVPGTGTTYLGLNLEAHGVSDPRLRRAIAMAIDRKRIVAYKLAGAATVANSLIARGHWAHTPDLPEYSYDPERARTLLATLDQSPPELTLRCASDRERVSMAQVIAAMLRDIGLRVRVRPSELSTLLADLSRGRFELTLMELPELLEPHLLSWFFASEHIPGPGREGANRWRFRNAELDEALERGRTSVALNERSAAYATVQRILAEELPVVPLWHRDMILVSTERFRNLPVPRNGRYSALLVP